MKHRAAWPIAVLLLAVSIACQYDPFAHEFTSVKPTDEELIGQYELGDEGIEILHHHDLPRPSSRLPSRVVPVELVRGHWLPDDSSAFRDAL